MPTVYQQPVMGRLPPTPPYTGSFEDLTMQPSYGHDAYSGQMPATQHRSSVHGYAHQYGASHAQMQHSNYQQSFHVGAYDHNLPPINYYDQRVRAPILPPLRVQAYEPSFYAQCSQQPGHQSQQADHSAPKKEEQATGGVSAKLDYEMEQMTDFVSEAAQGIIQPNVTVHPSFRKWVSQVLAATRLPSATILLSLHYLTVRMRQFPNTIDKSDQQLYRLLAVSLILGSKFLDDNTFINRSWSDVSGIKVAELNALEMQWLALIGFDLHADHKDENGVSLWLRAWKDYQTRADAKARAVKLAPLKTDLARPSTLNSSSASFQPSYGSVGTMTPQSSGSYSTAPTTPYISAGPWNMPDHNAAPHHTRSDYQSTYTAPMAPGYPSRYASEMDAYSGAQHYQQYTLPSLSSITPAYYTPWNQTTSWGQHAWGCRCPCCSRSGSFHNMGSHFPPQTVVG